MTRPASSSRLWALAALNAAMSLFLLVSFALSGIAQKTEAGCTAQIIDFHVFWSAARLALEGAAVTAFEQSVLRDAFNACNDGWLPWVHPAPAMALLMPFGLLPLIPAWAAWLAVSLVAYGLALHSFTKGVSAAWLAMLLAPALLPALLAGQFTVFWMAGLLGALAAQRAGRVVVAGVLIGCLTLKPTLGMLVPFALLGLGAWRTIGAAMATTLTLHGGALALFGGTYWTAWRAATEAHGTQAVAQIGNADTMSSLAAFLARLGMAGGTGVTLNLTVAVLLALVVFHVWRRHGASDTAVAVLVAAIPLATPYLWHYDAGFLALAALFLARACAFRPGPVLGFLLLVFWIGPGLPVWLAVTGLGDALRPIWILPPLMLAALTLSLASARKTPVEDPD